MSPPTTLTIEFRMVNILQACSPISTKTHVFLMSVLRSTSDHTPLKYRCPFKIVTKSGPLILDTPRSAWMHLNLWVLPATWVAKLRLPLRIWELHHQLASSHGLLQSRLQVMCWGFAEQFLRSLFGWPQHHGLGRSICRQHSSSCKRQKQTKTWILSVLFQQTSITYT